MQLPSPVQQISYRGHQIFVKRDDLIDPFISGNKWRKLKHIVEKAKLLNKNHLVTFGGAYSNHLLATAAAGAKLKFKTTAFVRGETVNNEMLMLCKLFGMQLIFTDRNSYRDKEGIFTANFSNDIDAYFVNEGGASAEGIIGCREIVAELETEYDHIFCAAGTGTTAAGILTEINAKKLNTILNVIPVLKGGNFIKDEISQHYPDTNQLVLHNDYHFGGYAKAKPELLTFIKDFTSTTGILIDPVYTAKMFYAIFDLIDKNKINSRKKILAIHTGGLFGLLGMRVKIEAIL